MRWHECSQLELVSLQQQPVCPNYGIACDPSLPPPQLLQAAREPVALRPAARRHRQHLPRADVAA